MPGPSRWSPVARDDLREVVRYVAGHNPSAARRLRLLIQRAADRLAVTPGHGRPVGTLGRREYVAHPNYVILYELRGSDVVILRIFHAARRRP